MEKDFETSLERLLVNWPIDETRLKVLAVELHKVFQEVGAERFSAGVDSIIRENPYQSFPTIAELRGHIPQPTESDAKKQRYIALREKFEFDRFIHEINYLAQRAAKYPDDARRCRFHRSRIIAIMHWWLRQYPACVCKLPDHLKWVTDEAEVMKYHAENPPPAVPGKWHTWAESKNMLPVSQQEGRKKADVDAAWAKWKAENGG